MVSKRWNFPTVDSENLSELCRGASCSETLAAVLLRRGVADLETATRFLEPRLLDLADPHVLPDIDRAVERITRAIQLSGQPDEHRPDGEKVAIFGDYDVDGVSSTCLLLDFFRMVECPVDFRLPDRLREGYGLRAKAVEELAANGITLIITVDNGSSSRHEIEVARELGVDVVVIDHHQPPTQLPEPYALVNPWLAVPSNDSGDLGSNAFKDLAGVGVTFKVVWALCQHFSRAKKLSPRFRQFLLDSMALVALGTVADVVPLREENRVLTKFGLLALQNSSRAGLKKLVEISRLGSSGDEPLDTSHIGFRIGPRLNAAGRLGRADNAIRLLLTDSETEAEELLNLLESENQRRRSIESEILEEARRRVQLCADLASTPRARVSLVPLGGR